MPSEFDKQVEISVNVASRLNTGNCVPFKDISQSNQILEEADFLFMQVFKYKISKS